MIKCSECGYENMDGLDYCDGCGAKLAAANAPAPDGGSPAHEAPAPAPEGAGDTFGLYDDGADRRRCHHVQSDLCTGRRTTHGP